MADVVAARRLDMLMQANRLKTTPRTGWFQRGVPSPESVADHSHGVALISLALLGSVPDKLDRAKVLAMAIAHDLAESVTGDLSLGACARCRGRQDGRRKRRPGRTVGRDRLCRRVDGPVGGIRGAGHARGQAGNDADRLTCWPPRCRTSSRPAPVAWRNSGASRRSRASPTK
ncbi:MAG: HD domain-containing protein [bacterium]|nr:HD domain-containing protein [bacterium]